MALSDEQLDDFVRHAVGASKEQNPVPLLADRVELLVSEVRRLRQERQEAEDNPCYCPMPHPRHHPPYGTDK